MDATRVNAPVASGSGAFKSVNEEHQEVPNYSYECKQCHHEFEMFHSMSASPRVKCAECGGPCKQLLGTGAGIIFKGSGFYETDYRRSAKGKPPDKDKASAKTEPKKEGKGDAKDGAKPTASSKD